MAERKTQQPTMAQIAAAYERRQTAPIDPARAKAEARAMPLWLRGAVGLNDAVMRAGNAATLGVWGRGVEALTGGGVSRERMQQDAAARLGKAGTIASDALGLYMGGKALGAVYGGAKGAVQAARAARAVGTSPATWAQAALQSFAPASMRQTVGPLAALAGSAWINRSPGADQGSSVQAQVQEAAQAAAQEAAQERTVQAPSPMDELQAARLDYLARFIGSNPPAGALAKIGNMFPQYAKPPSYEDEIVANAALVAKNIYDTRMAAASQVSDKTDRREKEIEANLEYLKSLSSLGGRHSLDAMMSGE